MPKALINPQILKWAITRKGVDVHSVTSSHIKYHDWESGESLPTFNQAKNLAKKLKIPFGYLFLSNPPKEEKPVADLRTVNDDEHHSYSADLLALIEDATRKQDWYREQLLIEQAEPLPFVGRYNLNDSIQVVANDIIETLSIGIEQRKGSNDPLRFLTEKCEDSGILVLRNGKVGANTHRKLDVEEFCGFALNDKYAPLIFINSADYKNPQIFTLAHEIAHIWIGKEGVSNLSLDNIENHGMVEQFCNKVAAETLVPADVFLEKWNQSTGTLDKRCNDLRRTFNVSTVVLARRALDLNLIKNNEFSAYYQELLKIWSTQKHRQKGGGSFYTSFPVTNSTTLTNAVCHSVYSGKMLLRNGARLLGVNRTTLDKYAKKGGFF